MAPDVFITVAFSGYAVLVCLGIAVALRRTSGRQDKGRRNDARWAVVKPERDRGHDNKREEKQANGQMHRVRRRRFR
jgi:hypothetical protein